ncbi:hypothetical protein BHM03_00030753 [Ensete ventricosum]|nr:hypothetical protein BHM03_00030753 [Ensete ventricosum]
MRGCIMSEGYPSFSEGLSELSPRWNFVGLGDHLILNSANKVRNLSSMRDSSGNSNASNLTLIESSDAIAYASRSEMSGSFSYCWVNGMKRLGGLVAERDGGSWVDGCASSTEGSATKFFGKEGVDDAAVWGCCRGCKWGLVIEDQGYRGGLGLLLMAATSLVGLVAAEGKDQRKVRWLRKTAVWAVVWVSCEFWK